jgi:hypothetical protein
MGWGGGSDALGRVSLFIQLVYGLYNPMHLDIKKCITGNINDDKMASKLICFVAVLCALQVSTRPLQDLNKELASMWGYHY